MVGIIQRLTDDSGYILRRFRCRLLRTREGAWKLQRADCWETYRVKLDQYFSTTEGDYYEWDDYKNTGVMRWCYARGHGYNWWCAEEFSTTCVLYPRNLKRLLKDTELKYIPVAELVRRSPGRRIDAVGMLREMRRHPQIEYFIKAGLYNIARAATEGANGFSYDRKKLWEVMQIPKEQLKMCINMDVTENELKALRAANGYGINLKEEELRFFASIARPERLEQIFRIGHVQKLKRYLQEELNATENESAAGDYIDYLNDLRVLRYPMNRETLFPRGFQERHAALAQERQERDNRIAKTKIEEKNKLLKAMLPEIKEIYSFEDEQMIVVLPTCKEDFRKEGHQNHNCVGGTYFDQMVKGETVVFFLRKKDNLEKSFCTVEMNEDEIIQCRAEYNREAPEEAKRFMERLQRNVRKQIVKKQKEQAKKVG